MSKRSSRIIASLVVFLPLATGLVAGAFAQESPTFASGNLVVVVEGCGVQGGTCSTLPNGTGTGVGNSSEGGYGDNEAGPLTLFQFTQSGAFINSLVLPQTSSGANLPVSGEYGSSSEGTLQLDGTGRYLTLMGYGINAATFDAAYHPATTPGNYATCSSSNDDPYGAAPSGALAQSGSLTGQCYAPVARVVALIDPYGNVNSSTALYNVFNTNNPRSVYTIDGTSVAYVSGQGSGCDATGGVFLTPIGVTNTAPTAITGLDANGGNSSCLTEVTIAQDTHDVQIYNGTLYVSVDSTEGKSDNRSFIGTLGKPPATSLYNSAAGPTQIPSENNASPNVNVTSTGKLVLTASETNGINSTGLQINLGPMNYFFASNSVLYVTDSGNPKQTSATSPLGDGGLQKWVNTKSDGSGNWKLQYTLAGGLNLVQNPIANPSDTSGTTGLYGLAGTVSNGTVYLYVTNYTIADLDPTYLYGITDTLSNTTNPNTSFTKLATAPLDSNFKGVSFVPTLPAGSATITSSPSGLVFTSTGNGCAPGTYTTPVTLIWTSSSPCQLSVVSPQTVAGTQYVFNQWQDGTTATTDSVTAPTTSAIYTASFTPVLTVTANSATIPAGAAVPALTASYTGFINGDTAASLSGSPALSTTATNSSPVGIYPITATQGSLTDPNYIFSFVNGTLSIVQGGTVELVTTASLTGSAGAGYTATVTVTNNGTATASNVQLTTASLGGKTGSPLPQSLGSLAAGGGSATVTVSFPGSAGGDGTRAAESYSGSSSGGTFSANIRAVLP